MKINALKVFLWGCVTFWISAIVEYVLKTRFPAWSRPSTIVRHLTNELCEWFRWLGALTAKLFDIFHFIQRIWNWFKDVIDWICEFIPIKEFLYTTHGLVLDIWNLVIVPPFWYFKGFFEYLGEIAVEYRIPTCIFAAIAVILFIYYISEYYGFGNGTLMHQNNKPNQKTRKRQQNDNYY